MKNGLYQAKLIFFALFCGFITTSCIQLFETIHFNKDGSGHAELIIDMSEMKSSLALMENALKEDEEVQDSLSMGMSMDELKDGVNLEEIVDELSQIKGITNIKAKENTDRLVFEYSFDFDNIDALNQAMTSGQGQSATAVTGLMGGPKDFKLFDLGKRFFERTYPSVNSGSEEVENEEAEAMAEMFLMTAFYKTEYHFDRKVKSVSNKDATISPDKRTVTLKTPFIEILKEENNALLQNKIKLR